MEKLACQIRTEEGRYGEVEIRKAFAESELGNVFRQLIGSELVAFGRKTSGTPRSDPHRA